VPLFILAPDGSIADQSEPLNVCSLAWSPDGERLLVGTLYGENFCGLYLLWRPGSDLEPLPEDLPSSYAQNWSPGGRLILFEDYSGSWTYDLVTQELEPALEQLGLPPGAATHFLWVPGR
jgi:hypothetical protein